MEAVMPKVFVEGDPFPLRPMANHGVLVGFSVARTLWRFGFEPGSDIARAFEVWTVSPLWVLCLPNGRPLQTAVLRWVDQPPSRFLHVLEVRVA